MTKKIVQYNESGIANLPDNKPVVYYILNKSGKPVYIGSAKRGRVKERISEHISTIQGAKVRIEQFSSIDEAQNKEKKAIQSMQPKYNKKANINLDD